jgi:hypothetical protein
VPHCASAVSNTSRISSDCLNWFCQLVRDLFLASPQSRRISQSLACSHTLFGSPNGGALSAGGINCIQVQTCKTPGATVITIVQLLEPQIPLCYGQKSKTHDHLFHTPYPKSIVLVTALSARQSFFIPSARSSNCHLTAPLHPLHHLQLLHAVVSHLEHRIVSVRESETPKRHLQISDQATIGPRFACS